MEKTLFSERRKDLLRIFAGTLLMAAATNLFYSPAEMIPGGFTGLAIIIRHLTLSVVKGGIPLWLANIILNVPLILFSILLRGWKFMRRTFIAAVLFSIHLFWIPELSLASDDLLLTSIFGGVIMGVGLALVLNGKATTGGTDTLAALLQRLLPYLSVARILPFLDGAIIVFSAFIFGIPLTLYAIISVVLAGAVADEITSGIKNARMTYIISDHYDTIADRIMNEMQRGVTMLHGTGMYTGSKKPVLMCAVSKKEIVHLRELVSETDPDAFMILVNASEVRGEGFLPYAAREEL
jgi:uncharacterized membrane-anchored protein YitT (DUF2179 family)